MPPYLKRAAIRFLLLTTALVPAVSGSLFAQLSHVRMTLASAGAEGSVSRSSSSVDTLPSAPSLSAIAVEPSFPVGPAAASFAPVTPVVGRQEVPPPTRESHRFWDRENQILFAGVAAFATADFFTTHANLDSGGRELNPVTRVLSGSTPGLAANFVLETGSVMGISYLFHRTGHHRLERITSFANMGESAGAVAYGLTHR